MNRTNRVIKVIIFFIIGILIFQKLNTIFIPQWVDSIDPATARIRQFYYEKRDTLDVIAVGSSEIGRGYSPLTIWKEYGVTSYNFGSSYQTMPIAYYKIKEILKYQKPKVILLGMDAIVRHIEATEESKRKLFDNMKLDNIKIEAIFDKNIEIKNKDKLSYFFPILRFHSRWGQLEKNNFKKSNKNTYKKVAFKGIPMIKIKNPYTGNKLYMEDKGEKFEILDTDLLYIDKIVKMCEENDVKLLWIEMPCPHSWDLAKSNATRELADKYKIDFIDLNLMLKDLNIDWDNDTYDYGGHLNIYGAEKVSSYLGKVIAEKYKCQDRRQDTQIANDWNKEVQKYEKAKKIEKIRRNKK